MDLLPKLLNRVCINASHKLSLNQNKISFFTRIGLLFLLVFCQACVTAGRNRSIKKWEAYEWKLRKPKIKGSNFRIYTRKVKESPYKEFKIRGVVRATPTEAILALRYRIEQWQEFYTEDQAYFEILENSSHELLVYSIFKLPFPFRDRSMCERFIIEEDTASGTAKITWQQEWEKAPPEKNVVRMPVARGSWTFEPEGENTCMATYRVYTEPGGMLPGWMYNSTVRKGLPKEFDAIESIVSSLKYPERKNSSDSVK